MQGFFTKKETESKTRPKGKTYSCASCGLLPGTLNPRFGPTGNFSKKILIIGAANTKAEDERRKHWQGSVGRLLQTTLSELGIDLFEDCISINAVSCACNEKPPDYSVECCRKNVERIIAEHKPKLIIACGESALYSLIGHHFNSSIGEFSRWRGWSIPDQDYKCWICPVYHPKFVQDAHGKEIMTFWRNDLEKAIRQINIPVTTFPEPEIRYIEDLSPLYEIEYGVVSIDYETTGKKPHAAGHRIVCCSVAISPNYALVFMMPESRADREPLIRLLQNPNVAKMAHNMKYEETWSSTRLKTPVQNWHWDSLIAAHVLDNRRGICGLKFQTYIHFGIADYSSEISQYLVSKDDEGSNAMNRVLELCETKAGQKKLMKYCALDTIYQYRLAMLQQDAIWSPF